MPTHYVLARYEKGLNLPPSYCVAGKGWTLSIGQATSFNHDDLVQYINCVVQNDRHFDYAIERRTQALEDRLHPQLMRRAVERYEAHPTHPHEKPIDIRLRHRFSQSTVLLLIALIGFAIGCFVYPLPVYGKSLTFMSFGVAMIVIGLQTQRFYDCLLRIGVFMLALGLGGLLNPR